MAIMCAAIVRMHVQGSRVLSRTKPHDRTRNFAKLTVERDYDIILRYLES